jgi:hypothetical protein
MLHHGPVERSPERGNPMKSFATRDQFDRLDWKIIAIDSAGPVRVAAGFRVSEIKR